MITHGSIVSTVIAIISFHWIAGATSMDIRRASGRVVFAHAVDIDKGVEAFIPHPDKLNDRYGEQTDEYGFIL